MMTWKKLAVCVCVFMFIGAVFAINITAAGPPLKDKVCETCHKDFAKIFPQKHPDMGKGEPCLTCHTTGGGEATKFSTEIHKVHKDKAKLECGACHAL